MRALLAVTMIALLTVPAVAQVSAGGGNFGAASSGGPQQNDPYAPPKAHADEKGYNAALSRMQDGKYDPWRSVRGGQGNSAPAPKSPK